MDGSVCTVNCYGGHNLYCLFINSDKLFFIFIAYISYYTHCYMWDTIIYLYLKFNDSTMEVTVCMCNYRQQFMWILVPIDIIDKWWYSSSGGRFKNTYELLNPRALKISMLYKNRIFQCMGKIFCVEFQRYPLKFHSKYLTHTLKDVHFIHRWKFKSS